MLPPQYMAGLPAAAFYGLQQPTAAMYGAAAAAYQGTGLEDLAALQRQQAGLHTLVGSTTATSATALAQALNPAGNPTSLQQPTHASGASFKGVWIREVALSTTTTFNL